VSASFRLWLGFIAMCFGMFMAVLDVQVVASSLTTMRDSLGLSISSLSWIQTAYLMAEVIAIPLTGWLTRALSLRWMFAGATAIFTIASLGCALSNTLPQLIALRALQGFSGGMLIPAVFTAVFTHIPERHRVLATAIAGTFAVLAPAIGPVVGGYLTETHSWHWIFLINILPGVAVAMLVAGFVHRDTPNWRALTSIDAGTIATATLFLASLEILLTQAPGRDWQGSFVYALGATALIGFGWTVWRGLRLAHPFVDLRRFRSLAFSIGCGLSFVFGFGLYGSVYMLSLFLGLVRGHTPLEIGTILMVMGAVQLVTAPLAAWLEIRIDPRLLTAVGFSLFGLGLLANGFETPRTDFDAMILPQVLRGLAVMICLLPATRLALDALPDDQVPEASALFNLMRTLGGAIGIALIDTILTGRTQGHVSAIVARLAAGDRATAAFVGLPLDRFHGVPLGAIDTLTRQIVEPLVRRAALTQSFNEAWLLIAGLFLLSLAAVPLIRKAHLKPTPMGPGAD
jgi:DHA2 family multidrug resistance protein